MACVDEAKRSFRTSIIHGNAQLAPGIHELSIPWPGAIPKPGQFFMLRPVRSSVFLGRPISVAGADANSGADANPGADADLGADANPGADADGGGCALRFIIAERGRGTAELIALRAGDEVELSGPLGNTWPEEASAQSAHRKPIALVGGGIGIAPLLFFATTLPAGSYDFYAGFRSKSYGLEGLEARTTVVATEDGCEGCTGRIPDFIEGADYSAVYACGPEAMLRAVVQVCESAGTPCWLSLERRMACGVGACLGCTVATKAGNRRCCVDGPVFSSQEVIFDA